MAERKTETTISIYSGVPFNNKYKNVLFVSRETRDTFLSSYEIGTDIKVNRFEIVDDTQAMIDVETDYAIIANYCKVHRKLMPLSNENVYEYESFYFINRCVQIATNVVRLYLEIDVFQTYFNRYDYQAQAYEIPRIKNSNLKITTEYDVLRNYEVLTKPNFFNASNIYSPLFERTDANNNTRVRVVMHFVTNESEYCCISKKAYNINYTGQTIPINDNISQIVESVYSSKQMAVYGNNKNISVIDMYLVPEEFFANETFSEFTNECFYDYGSVESRIYFYLRTMYTMNPLVINKTKTISASTINQGVNLGIKYTVGTMGHQVEIEHNNFDHTIKLQMIFDLDFQIFMSVDNQIIELTDDFKFSIFESQIGSYMQQHQNTLALKNISNVVSIGLSLARLSSGDPTSILGLIGGIEKIAGDVGMLTDLENQPLKLNGMANCITNLILYNGIGIFNYVGLNVANIIENDKYFGRKTQLIKSKTFTHIATPTINFDFYKFDDVELIAKIPENFKTQIENMFINGVRIWYTPTNFLTTIERTIPQNP